MTLTQAEVEINAQRPIGIAQTGHFAGGGKLAKQQLEQGFQLHLLGKRLGDVQRGAIVKVHQVADGLSKFCDGRILVGHGTVSSGY